jgi:broad specificity phosphatase PhoE
MSLKLLIIRHGETYSNKEGKLDGQSDTQLTPKGIQQAKKLSKIIEKEKITKVYCSPLKRSYDTVNISTSHNNQQIEIEKSLIEINCGKCTLMSISQITNLYPKLIQGWADLSDPRFPNGENLKDVQVRVIPFIKKIISQHKSGTILIGGHGAVNIAILGYFLNIPQGLCWKIEQENCCLNEIFIDSDGFKIKKINYTCHLGVLKKS